MSASTSDVAGPRGRRRHPGLTLSLLAFAQLIISVDYNIVYVALPEIGKGLGFSTQTMQWVVSAYAVTFGGFLLLGGRACDLLGRRRMFVAGLFLYAVASLAGGLATTPALLIAARAVQGLGGALLFPATLSLVNTAFVGDRERYRALSIWAAAGASGMVLGSLLGGVLTEAFGWTAVFFVNVPLAGVALLLAFPLVDPDGRRASGRAFDLPGALTATLGSTLVVFTLVQGPTSGWGSPGIIASAIAGMALLGVFVVIESRSRDPLMPLRLFGSRNLSTGVLVTFLFMATFGTLLYFLTVYFQYVHGYSALGTGMAFVIPMALGCLGSIMGGRLAMRFGIRATLLASLFLGGVGTLTLGLLMSTGRTYGALLPALLVVTACQGVVFTTMFGAASSDIAPQEQGIASGIVSTGQQVGSAVGLAVLVAIANSGTHGLAGEPLRTATATGLRMAVLAAAVGIAVTILVALNFKRAASGAPGQVSEPVGAEQVVHR